MTTPNLNALTFISPVIDQKQVDESYSLLDKYFKAPDNIKLQQQGCYLYYLNHQQTNIIEPWRIFISDNNDLFIQSVRYVKDTNIAIAVEYTGKFNPQKIIELTNSCTFSVNLSWWQNNKCLQLAHYEQKQKLTFTLTSSPQQMSPQIINQQERILFPLMRIFSGQTIANIFNQITSQVIVPDIRQGANTPNLFEPTISTRQVTEKKSGNVNNQFRCFLYQSDIYKEENTAMYWLDNDNRLVQYQWQQTDNQHWLVQLAY